MIVQITEFVLPNGNRKYHEHDFPETDNLTKALEAGASFEFERLTNGMYSLEIVAFDDAGDPELSEMRLLSTAPSKTIAQNFEEMVELFGAKL